MTRYKERYLSVVHYGTDPDRAGPIADNSAVREAQVVSDWNRMLKKGEQCPYIINGRSVFKIREGKPFSDPDDLKSFLKEHLLKNTLAEEEQKALDTETTEGQAAQKKLDELAHFTFMHCHQGGLPHTTHYSLIANRTDDLRFQRAVPEPTKMSVNFDATPEGLFIKENNIYTQWRENPGPHEKIHISTNKGKPYYAQTKSIYLITPDKKNIELLQLDIDCPSKNLAPIFNKLEEHTQVIQNFFSTLLIKLGLKKMPVADNSPEEGHAYFYKDGKVFNPDASATETSSEGPGTDSDDTQDKSNIRP